MGSSLLSESLLVFRKDLQIQRRSRVAMAQVAPFAFLVLIIFAFSLDGDLATLKRLTSGLYWIAVLFSALLIIQRAFTLESQDGVRDALRLSGLHPNAIFLGKTAAIFLQIVVIEILLGLGVVVFYSAELTGWGLLLATAAVAPVGIAAAGTLYGVLTAGLRVKETLLPILLLPALAPLLIAATRTSGSALGEVAVNGWSWFNFLAIFALLYVGLGLIAFTPLLEES